MPEADDVTIRLCPWDLVRLDILMREGNHASREELILSMVIAILDDDEMAHYPLESHACH